jgi:hypothetical protein
LVVRRCTALRPRALPKAKHAFSLQRNTEAQHDTRYTRQRFSARTKRITSSSEGTGERAHIIAHQNRNTAHATLARRRSLAPKSVQKPAMALYYPPPVPTLFQSSPYRVLILNVANPKTTFAKRLCYFVRADATSSQKLERARGALCAEEIQKIRAKNCGVRQLRTLHTALKTRRLHVPTQPPATFQPRRRAVVFASKAVHSATTTVTKEIAV